jgi:signal transduction histidine kinase/ActR/RegA family two-component response regulator
MKIQTRILLSVAASLAISAIIVAIVLSILRKMDNEFMRHGVYDEIRNKTHALNLTIAESQSRPDPTRIHQIRQIRRSLENLLGSMTFFDIHEKSLVRRIRTNSRELGSSFEKLITSYSDPGKGTMSKERYDILVSQLLMKNQVIADDTLRLTEISQSRIDAVERKALVMTIALIVSLILINAAISFFTGRSIARMQEDLTQALAKAEEGDRMLSALMEHVPEGISIADADLNLKRISRFGRDLVEDRREGKSLPDIVRNWKVYHADGETPMAFEDLPLVRAVQRGEVVKNTEMVQINARGERMTMLVTAGPIHNAGGKVIGGIVIWRDITDRNQILAALRQLNEILERRVAERTELAEGRAKQLQFLAAELIEAEENERQRIAQLLHDDLQQILASARLQLQAVCADLPPEPILANVGKLLEESIAKSRRLSHELSPMMLHHSDLTAALKWLSGQMSQQFGLRVRLNSEAPKHFENTPLKVFAFRAVQELLFNVVKHAGVKEAEVGLSGSDGSLTVTVRDQGRGFNCSILESSATKAGLGLLSMRERASYIGGSLTIESSPGQGSRFTLTLPCNMDKDTPHQSIPEVGQQLHTQAAAAITADAEGIRVLFVDDHHVMRQALIGLFNGQPNIRVVGEAANGREALELTRQLRPDVVVMDISMPEMDGIEATRRIKAELPEVRVLGLSMFEDRTASEAMRNAGAEAFVSKTASTADLLKAIYGITRHQDD